METSAAIVLEGLTKDYGVSGWRQRKRPALDRVSWRLPAGTVGGLLGPNGCGKSTSLRVILGLSRPTAGTCRVFGGSPTDPAVRRRVGYLPQGAEFQPFLTGRELVKLHAQLAGVARVRRAQRVQAILEEVGLAAYADRRLGTYSVGLRRRLGLAQALVHEPDLLILDEPLAGVDPRGVEEILALLGALKQQGKTVLLTSHLLPQVETLCDHVALLHEGRLVAAGPVPALQREEERQALIVDSLPAVEQRDLEAWLADRGRRLHRVETPKRGGLERFYLAQLSEAERREEERGWG